MRSRRCISDLLSATRDPAKSFNCRVSGVMMLAFLPPRSASEPPAAVLSTVGLPRPTSSNYVDSRENPGITVTFV